MKRTETIIFGGAFNPPTLSHVKILQAIMRYARDNQAEVWIMPSGNRTDKTIAVTRERRLQYLQAMLADVEDFGVKTDIITTELDRPVMVETFDTVKELSESFPDRTFTFFFGADSTETMGQWKGGDWLLAELPMLVVRRAGSVINPAAQLAVELDVPELVMTSSTEVRSRLAEGLSVKHLVSPHVHLVLR